MDDIQAHRRVNKILRGHAHDVARSEALIDLLLARAKNTETDPIVLTACLQRTVEQLLQAAKEKS